MKILLPVLVLALIIGGSIYYVVGTPPPNKDQLIIDKNVSMVDGKQIIDLTAKGGYWPNVSDAKSNFETILRVKTDNTTDCSQHIVIPELRYDAVLKENGIVEIAIPPQKEGTKLQGSCSLGIFTFAIKFE